jgi:hypothetical protein
MSTPHLTILPNNPDFLDLPWSEPLADWDVPNLVELPTGVHRHVVRFAAYGDRIYAIKELPLRHARNEFTSLRTLQERNAPVVEAVGLVERAWLDPREEGSAAVITRYLDYAFPYRELITGGDFGPRRTQLLDGFAGLLVELHLRGCFWGDCSLSNVLYRYDAAALDITMVDGETVELHDALSAGQRYADLEIMVVNVAGGMADIAAESDGTIDDADMTLGAEVIHRYERLWEELNSDWLIGPDERYRITERTTRLNDLGFEVAGVASGTTKQRARRRRSTRPSRRSDGGSGSSNHCLPKSKAFPAAPAIRSSSTATSSTIVTRCPTAGAAMFPTMKRLPTGWPPECPATRSPERRQGRTRESPE